MYNCEICAAHVGPRVALTKHIIYRHNKQIHREMPVCPQCKAELDAGVPLDIMLKQHGKPLRLSPVVAPTPVERPKTLGKPVFLGKPITRRANG